MGSLGDPSNPAGHWAAWAIRGTYDALAPTLMCLFERLACASGGAQSSRGIVTEVASSAPTIALLNLAEILGFDG